MNEKTLLVPDLTGPIRYPEVRAALVGQDGNVFNLIGIVSRALKRAGVSADERDAFPREVMAAENYDAALQVMMRWVTVE